MEKQRLDAGQQFAVGAMDSQKSFTEDEIRKDPSFAEAYRHVYKYLNNEDVDGTDEELSNQGMQLVSDIRNPLYTVDLESNTGLGLIGSYMKFKDAPQDVKDSLWYMWDNYEKADMTASAFGRALKSIGKDPSSYAGFALGAKFFGQKAASSVAMNRFKNMLIGGATSGAYTGGEEVVRQEVSGEEDFGKIKQMASIGAVIGVVAPPVIEGVVKGTMAGTKVVGQKIAQTIKEGEELMAQQAGGGAVPKIDQTFDGYSYSAPGEIKDLFHSGNLDQINPDKILWTTGNKDYALKFGKKDTKQLYQIEKENLNILDGYSEDGKKILEEANSKASKPMSELLNPDGGVSSFVIQDDKVIQYLKGIGYDAVRTSESYASTNPAVGIINPNKVKINPIKGSNK